MLRSILLTAAALLLGLSGSAQACSCLGIPPLSQCSVAKGSAALLVTFDCVKTVACNINDGVAVADVTIDRVFKDSTGLDLEKGDMATISSLLSSASCGFGGSFFPGDRWIVFVRPPEPVSSRFIEPPPDVFSDGSICDVQDSDFTTTSFCTATIRDPTAAQIEQLAEGCANPIVVTPPVFTSGEAE